MPETLKIPSPPTPHACADPGLPGPPQEVLPKDVMTKRRKRNPREKPADGADAAYD